MNEQNTRTRTAAQLAGGLLWFATLVWFFGQYAAQAAWTTPYSLAGNYVSDLGAVGCGNFPPGTASYVCSPQHGVFNTATVLTGAFWMVGGILLAVAARRRHPQGIAYLLVALGGLATMVIGFVPEDVNIVVHGVAAAVQNVGLAAGLVLLGRHSLRSGHRWAGGLSLLVAAAALVGLIATAVAAAGDGTFLGIGLGLWERAALWSIPVWLAVAGVERIWAMIAPAIHTRPTASSTGEATNAAH